MPDDLSIPVEIRGAWAYLDQPYPRKPVEAVTSFRPRGFWNVPAFKKKVQQPDGSYKRAWDGYKRLMHCPRQGQHRFPAGLIGEVRKSLEAYGRGVRVTGWPEPVPPRDVTLVGIEFGGGKWRHQREALEAALKSGRGILKIATGGGKTAIGTAIGKIVGGPVLVCAYGRELVLQWRREIAGFLGFKDTPTRIGLIGGGIWDEGDGDFIVASVPTLALALDKSASCEDHSKKADKKCLACQAIKEAILPRYEQATALLNRPKVFIQDEAHRSGADDHYEVAMACAAPYRFGMSATPLDRSDGATIRVTGATGEVIYSFGVDEGVEAEVILQPRVRMRFVYEPVLMPSDLKWDDAYQMGVVENFKRNEMVVEEAANFRKQGLRTLVAVQRIDHGEILEKMIPGSLFVSGEMSDAERDEALDAFRAGEVDCLVSTVLAEGVNLPEIDAVVLAFGWKSPIPLLQRIGRGTRSTGKLDYLPVVDFADMACVVLLEHSLERLAIYKKTPGYVIVEEQ